MAFNPNTQTKSKHQFAARIVSNKEHNRMVGWLNITDEMARSVFRVQSVHEITFAAAAEKLPMLLDNERTHVIVTDINASVDAVDINDF